MNLDPAAIRPDVISLVPEETCRKYRILPIDRIENSLMLAMADPSNVFALDDVKFLTGYDVVPIASTAAAIADALDRVRWPTSGNEAPEPPRDTFADDEGDSAEALADSPDDPPVIRLVHALLRDAIDGDATDIHITPGEDAVRVAYRIDGALRQASVIPLNLRDVLTSRLKIMARLDIAEKRLPQDGRIAIRLPRGDDCDIRLATLPILHGERIIMRLDRPDRAQRDLHELGLPPALLERFRDALKTTSGLMLIAGLPRSGRTTTAHAVLRHLNDGTRAILTAEDSVRAHVQGVSQAQVRESIGLTYAAALRSFLRHDPDVVYIQRAPDEETAALLVKASVEHPLLALTSVTATDAADALVEFTRLTGNREAAAAALTLVVFQNLKPKAGGKGRELAAEMLMCSGPVRKALLAGADAEEIARMAAGAGLLIR